MKVLMVSKALVVASYRRKVEALCDLGVQVAVVVPPQWQEEKSRLLLEDGAGEYELIVAPLRRNGHFHTHYYPTLGAIMDQVRPNLVHVDEEPYNLATYLAARAARRRRIRSLFFTWQNIQRTYPFPFRAMEQRVYRWTAHAIAGTAAAAAVLRSKGYTKDISVIPQFGVDTDVFHPGKIKSAFFTVGFVNRLVPEKGPMLALQAFAQLPGDARMRIVGDGPLRREVEQQVTRLNLQDRVTVQGRVPSAEMPDLLRRLDAVVLPSLTTPTWKEQFGRVLVEAMASGVAVVGSDSGQIPEVIGSAGLIVPENDVDALARALRRLYYEFDLRDRLARKARERVLERFTQASVAEQTKQVYEDVLTARGDG